MVLHDEVLRLRIVIHLQQLLTGHSEEFDADAARAFQVGRARLQV
jgi:hypothetical protein